MGIWFGMIGRIEAGFAVPNVVVFVVTEALPRATRHLEIPRRKKARAEIPQIETLQGRRKIPTEFL